VANCQRSEKTSDLILMRRWRELNSRRSSVRALSFTCCSGFSSLCTSGHCSSRCGVVGDCVEAFRARWRRSTIDRACRIISPRPYPLTCVLYNVYYSAKVGWCLPLKRSYFASTATSNNTLVNNDIFHRAQVLKH